LVSPQIILVGLALIAFFATGGIDKASRALTTAKTDFTRVKGSFSKFRNELTAKEEMNQGGILNECDELCQKNNPEIFKTSLKQNFQFPTDPEAIKQKLGRGI
jgi:hypothetical protein